MKHKISAHESTIFLENFIQAYTHGYTIPQVLRLVAKGSRSQASIATLVSTRVESGHSLTDALVYGEVIRPNEVSLAVLGEQSGEYIPVLTYIIESRKRRHHFLQELIALLLYPSIVALLMGGVCVFIMTAIIPSLVRVFVGMNIALPVHTRLLIWLSEYVWTISIVAILGIVSMIGFFVVGLKSRYANVVIESLFRLPLFGGLIQNMYARVIIHACMIAIGLPTPLTESLTRLMENADQYSRNQFQKIQSLLERGNRLSESVQTLKCMKPVYALQMCFGEETGQLQSVLRTVLVSIEQENSRYTKLFTKLCEPVLMIGLGAGVIFIASAVLSPLYEITRHVKK